MDMNKKPAIVRGNDFVLGIPLFKKVLRDGEMVVEPFPVSEAEDLKVYFVDYLNVRREQPYTRSGDNMLMVSVDGDQIRSGSYGIEISGMKDGRNIRSRENDQFSIVESNDRSNVTPYVYEGSDAYNIDQHVFVDFRPSSGGVSSYDDLTDKPKINNVTISGNMDPETLGLQPSGDYVDKKDLAEKANRVTVQRHGTSDTTFTLTPNVFHIWDEVKVLSLSLLDGDGKIMDEYMFEFTSGASATVLTLPDDVRWIGENTPESGRTYQVSIVNRIAVMGGA